MTRRRLTILSLVLACVAAWWVAVTSMATWRVPASAADRAAGAAVPLPPVDDDRLRLRLRLEPPTVPPIERTRNPFVLQSAVPTDSPGPMTRRPLLTAAGRGRAPEGAETPAPVPFTLVGIATGRADEPSTRVAILSGRGELLHVTPGDTLGSRHVVVAIGDDVVELRDLSTGLVQRLALR
jgi:hypothetical protein